MNCKVLKDFVLLVYLKTKYHQNPKLDSCTKIHVDEKCYNLIQLNAHCYNLSMSFDFSKCRLHPCWQVKLCADLVAVTWVPPHFVLTFHMALWAETSLLCRHTSSDVCKHTLLSSPIIIALLIGGVTVFASISSPPIIYSDLKFCYVAQFSVQTTQTKWKPFPHDWSYPTNNSEMSNSEVFIFLVGW